MTMKNRALAELFRSGAPKISHRMIGIAAEKKR